MGDLRDRVRNDQTALETLMGAIPGFKGYQDKEDRRDADKLLRMHLVGLLNDANDHLLRFQAKLSAEGQFKPVTDLNRISRRLVHTRDRIEHASYGYAGFFDPLKIEAAELDRLYEFDASLRDYIANVDAAAAKMGEASAEERGAAIMALGEALDELDHMVDQRNEAAAQLAP